MWGPTLLFVMGLTASAQAEDAPNSEPGATFVDTDGTVRRVDEAEQDVLPVQSGDHLRVWIGIGAGLAVGSFAYWVDQDQNVADWDDPNVKARLSGDAWRFDNNNLVVNFLLHPLSGGGTYNLARTSHFSVPVSAGYSVLSSFLWEWVLEFKEQISVNDCIVTPLGGIPIGEFFYKLGLYLDSAHAPGFGMRTAQWTLGTGVQIDRLVDGPPLREPHARDALGLTSAIWHDFGFRYSVSAARGRSASEFAVHDLGFRGRLVTIPGYLRPGSYGYFFHRADVTDLEVWAEGSHHGVGLGLEADTLLLGYHAQQIGGTVSHGHGHAATVGASLGYQFLDSAAHGFAERLALLHLPGLGFDWNALARDIRLSVRLRANPDFAAVGALAQSDWQAAYPDERGKAVLRNQGYFYGWGGSGRLSGAVALGPLRLDADTWYGRYWSQEGLERHPERLTVDAPAEASVFFARGGIGLSPPGTPITLGATASVRRWDSTVGEFRHQARAVGRGLFVEADF